MTSNELVPMSNRMAWSARRANRNARNSVRVLLLQGQNKIAVDSFILQTNVPISYNRPLSNYASVPANINLKSRLKLILCKFHNHAQNVQAVVLAGHTSRKHGGLYE